ncbi:MAG TPA: hypothetical protein VHD33_03425 [Legionellaceae bacterium]|nr:hypothetical protein [Legionellaceae bacterium]
MRHWKHHLYHSVSWSAVFAGAVAGVGINFLLNLFALAFGIASFAHDANGHTIFSAMGFLWFCIAAIIAMFITGWLAGRLTPRVMPTPHWGIVYGFLAWSLLLILTIILITNMIQYMAFHSNFTSNLVEIRLTSQAPMLTMTKAHQSLQSPLKFNIETHKKIIILNGVLTFVLFMLGAITSGIGGYLGHQKSQKPRINGS